MLMTFKAHFFRSLDVIDYNEKNHKPCVNICIVTSFYVCRVYTQLCCKTINITILKEQTLPHRQNSNEKKTLKKFHILTLAYAH